MKMSQYQSNKSIIVIDKSLKLLALANCIGYNDKKHKINKAIAMTLEEIQNRIFIKDIYKDLLSYLDEETLADLIEEDPSNIKYIANPTVILKALAVTLDPKSVKYIKDTSESLQLSLVDDDSSIIEHIQNPTYKVCIEAIYANPANIFFIKKPSEYMIYIAAKKDAVILKHFPKISEKYILKLLKDFPRAIEYIPNCTDDMRIIALNHNIWAFCAIENPSEKVQHWMADKCQYSKEIINLFFSEFEKRKIEPYTSVLKKIFHLCDDWRQLKIKSMTNYKTDAEFILEELKK